MDNGLNLNDAIKQFLVDYRSTPHSAIHKTLAKLFLGRELRTRFSLLRPREIKDTIYMAQNRQVRNHKGARAINFDIGDTVMVTDYRGKGNESWIKAQVIEEIIPGVTFRVEVAPDIIWKRHSNQIRECSCHVPRRGGYY